MKRSDGRLVTIMKIVIIGRTRMLHNAALMLMDRGCKIAGIVTAKAAPEYDCREEEYASLAKDLAIPYFFTTSLDLPSVREFLANADADVGVSVNWVGIVRDEDIKYFRYGILNAHLGDIPRYRGNACTNWAIINGEKEIVLSVHYMEGGRLDCGRILVQNRMVMNGNTYIGDVHRWANDMVPRALADAVDVVKKDPEFVLKYADPNSVNSFRCYPRRPEDSRIDWSSAAIDIHRLVRASAEPYSGAYTTYMSRALTIWRSSLIDDTEKYCAVPGQVCSIDKSAGTVTVITGDGKIVLNQISYGSQERVMPATIIRSIRIRLGV